MVSESGEETAAQGESSDPWGDAVFLKVEAGMEDLPQFL